MSTRGQRALFYTFVGTLWENKLCGFWGEYNCKAETKVIVSKVPNVHLHVVPTGKPSLLPVGVAANEQGS